MRSFGKIVFSKMIESKCNSNRYKFYNSRDTDRAAILLNQLRIELLRLSEVENELAECRHRYKQTWVKFHNQTTKLMTVSFLFFALVLTVIANSIFNMFITSFQKKEK